MKKKILLTLSILSVLSLTACKPTSVKFILSEIKDGVEIHSQDQLTRFIDVDFSTIYQDRQLHYLDGLLGEDYSKCIPIELAFTAEVDRGHIDSIEVKVSEHEDMSDSYSFSTSSSPAKFYNAKINTTYYWQLSTLSFTSEIAHFKTTSKTPRVLSVDGVKNVRDIGGSKIKQGLIYRGGAFEEFDKKTTSVVTNITNNGKKTLSEQLKIKTDIDLRKDKDSSNPIPENCALDKSTIGANLKQLPMYYGGNNILTYKDSNYDNPSKIKEYFEILSDKNNFPVYMHCSEGKDRTGCLAYLTEALCGESEEYMYRDYLFSNFANVLYGMKADGIDGQYGKTLKNYKNSDTETMASVTYRYLNEVIGISTDTLDSVIDNLTK